MRYRVIVAAGLLFASMHARAFLVAAGQALPVKDGRPVVATVNGEPISLDEFVMQREASADAAEVRRGYGSAKDFELLDRLVNVKLIVQEAETMGLAEQPEIRRQVEVTSRAILRDVLMERLVKDVTADPAAVEEMFKDLVKEWKTASLLFQDEASASRAREEIAAGASFAEVGARAVAAKTAHTDADTEFHPRKKYLPQVAEAIAALQVGQVSPVLRIQAGFVVVTVTDVRYPERAEARTEAQKMVLSRQQTAVLHEHEEALKQGNAVIDKAVLDSLDYQAATPGIEALRTDERVLARIKGAPPVTVGDLTDYLRMQSYHGGADQAGLARRMNATKDAALDATLGRRLLNLEARRLGLDKTNEYRERVKAYEESLVFESFVQKVIKPDSRMTEEEVKGHYDGHLKEFSSPEMVRIRGLAFTGRGAAEAAMGRLREGADYSWLVANAGGQVSKGAEGLLTLDGRPVTTDSMPEGLQKAVAGAKAGESRLYASPEGHFYVLSIQAVIAPNARPYDEVREEIAKTLYGQKLTKGVEEYIGTLRAASTIETYLKKLP